MRIYLTIQWINIKVYLIADMARRIGITILYIKVSKDKLLWNIYCFYRNVKKFTNSKVKDTICNSITFFTFYHVIDKEVFRNVIRHFSPFQLKLIIEYSAKYIYLL